MGRPPSKSGDPKLLFQRMQSNQNNAAPKALAAPTFWARPTKHPTRAARPSQRGRLLDAPLLSAVSESRLGQSPMVQPAIQPVELQTQYTAAPGFGSATDGRRLGAEIETAGTPHMSVPAVFRSMPGEELPARRQATLGRCASCPAADQVA